MNAHRADYFVAVRAYLRALGVKVVNPAGISAFKFNQRKLDVDERHVHWQVSPRQVVGVVLVRGIGGGVPARRDHLDHQQTVRVTKPGGRDQRAPMERLIGMLARLHHDRATRRGMP